jgi:hypothetical protein
MMTYMLSQYADLPLSQKTLAGWLEKWIYEQERRCTDEAFSAQFPWQETGLPQHDFLQRKLRIAGRHFLTGPVITEAISTDPSLISWPQIPTLIL